MKKNAADIAYQQIKQKIMNGEYVPAQRLIESTLAEELDVGRHHVRSALDRLQSDGLVHIEPNRGASVKSLDLDEVIDILTARGFLEAGVAQLAADHISADQIGQLEFCIKEMRTALDNGDYDLYSATNKRFHHTIYESSGNETMPQMINSLRQRLARLQFRTILIPGRTERSLKEHEAICRALQSRDATAAAHAASQHIHCLKTAIEQSWQLVRH